MNAVKNPGFIHRGWSVNPPDGLEQRVFAIETVDGIRSL
jgi:hypothetical protein